MELGKHLIVELQGCDSRKLECAEEVERLLVEAAKSSGLTIMGVKSHFFNPGTTSVVIVGESHLTIHTWPEYGYAAVDIFVCGDRDPLKALGVIVEGLKPRKVRALKLRRGLDVLHCEDVTAALEGLVKAWAEP